MEQLKTLLEKFIQSDKEHGIKKIAVSDLFFDVDPDEMEQTRKQFVQHYEQYKKQLIAICGKPITEDVPGFTFKDFELTKNEKKADLLTLFSYKNVRFGILLYQEDRELPIELCLSAFRVNS
jgi:hypothetical protein